jgi:hypothetical protein
MKLQYDKSEEFEKDFKKLLKRFRTLNDDLEVAKKNTIELYHIHHLDNSSIERIPEFQTDKVGLYKIVKFACRALKGRGAKSGIRIIYAFSPATLMLKFIEIYFKQDAENMDYEKAKRYFKSVS